MVRTHAGPDVFPALPRIRRPPSDWARTRCIRAQVGVGLLRTPGAAAPRPRHAGRPVGEARSGLGQRGGDLVAAAPRRHTPPRARRSSPPAGRRSDRPGTTMHGDAPARAAASATPDDDLAAQGLPVERPLPGDDEVGGGQRASSEADRVEHGLDARLAAGPPSSEQGRAETAGGAGPGHRAEPRTGSRGRSRRWAQRTTPRSDPARRRAAARPAAVGALLRAEDGARAVQAEQRGVDVGGRDEVDAAQPGRAPSSPATRRRAPRRRTARRHRAESRRGRRPSAASSPAPPSLVAEPPSPIDDRRAPRVERRGDQQAEPVRGGGLRVALGGGEQVQPARLGALHVRRRRRRSSAGSCPAPAGPAGRSSTHGGTCAVEVSASTSTKPGPPSDERHEVSRSSPAPCRRPARRPSRPAASRRTGCRRSCPGQSSTRTSGAVVRSCTPGEAASRSQLWRPWRTMTGPAAAPPAPLAPAAARPGQPTRDTERGVECPGDLPAPSDPDLVARARAAKAALGDQVFVLGHHYQRDEVIEFADVTGDSFKLAREAAARPGRAVHRLLRRALHGRVAPTSSPATTRRSILPDLAAGCSMADMAAIDAGRGLLGRSSTAAGRRRPDRAGDLHELLRRDQGLHRPARRHRLHVVQRQSAPCDWAFEQAAAARCSSCPTSTSAATPRCCELGLLARRLRASTTRTSPSGGLTPEQLRDATDDPVARALLGARPVHARGRRGRPRARSRASRSSCTRSAGTRSSSCRRRGRARPR